jgi:hypothetical protein
LAGIVKRLKNRQERKLMPLYFFRLENCYPQKIKALSYKGDRGLILSEPLGKFIYVLYFPKKAVKKDTIILNLEK